MLLAVDARNSSVALGFRGEDGWRARLRLGVTPTRTADEFALLFSLAAAGAGKAGEGRVDRAMISSVVPGLTPRLVAAVAAAFGVEASVVGPGTRTGLRIRSDLPQELGSDIVCEAVAAKSLAPGRPCVILDFGDALVFSALNSGGDFLGAAIAPGLGAAARSLHEEAALLPLAGPSQPPRAIGRSTLASIQAGLYHGYAGLVERLVALFRAELSGGGGGEAEAIELLVTGDQGGAELAAPLSPLRFIPDLALEGLALIADLQTSGA